MRVGYSKPQRSREAGYMLLLILFLLALLTVVLLAAAPSMARQIQRNRELELIHRGQQYARAIRMYYRKFGRYPTSVKDLLETNDIRFLRKPFKDPMTASGDWRLIHAGESSFNPTGFFGQKLLPGTSNPGASLASSSIFTPGNGAPQNGTAQSGAPQNNAAQPSAGDHDQNGSDTGSQKSGEGGGIFGSSGSQTFGGGPIVGVASTDKDKSLIIYNGKDHYNDWEFVYDPRMEQVTVPQGLQVKPGANGPVQQPQPASNPGTMPQ